MLMVDGGIGEAGGQVLRSALAFAAVHQKAITITNIRANRPQPGLKPQHLEGVKALQAITQGKLEGGHLGSQQIMFEPSELRGGQYTIEVGTAGACSLIVQAILPVLAFCKEPSQVIIKGGTDVQWAPPADYLVNVLLPVLREIGVNAALTLKRRGHYPRGGGEIRLETRPSTILVPFLHVEAGRVTRIDGNSHCVRLPSHVAARQANAAIDELKRRGHGQVVGTIHQETYPPDADLHLGPGSGITLWGELAGGTRVGGDALGAPGLKAEEVGRRAAQSLIAELEAEVAVDTHLADHLIFWAALNPGVTRFLARPLSSHSTTMIELMHNLSGRSFSVIPRKGAVEVVCAPEEARGTSSLLDV